MKQKQNVHKCGSAEEIFDNIFTVINDFMALASMYGKNLQDVYDNKMHNRKSPSDRRFKVYVNGSYFELAGYTFSYGMYHGTDEIWWTCVDFDATIILKGQRMTLGEGYVTRAIELGVL